MDDSQAKLQQRLYKNLESAIARFWGRNNFVFGFSNKPWGGRPAPIRHEDEIPVIGIDLKCIHEAVLGDDAQLRQALRPLLVPRCEDWLCISVMNVYVIWVNVLFGGACRPPITEEMQGGLRAFSRAMSAGGFSRMPRRLPEHLRWPYRILAQCLKVKRLGRLDIHGRYGDPHKQLMRYLLCGLDPRLATLGHVALQLLAKPMRFRPAVHSRVAGECRVKERFLALAPHQGRQRGHVNRLQHMFRFVANLPPRFCMKDEATMRPSIVQYILYLMTGNGGNASVWGHLRNYHSCVGRVWGGEVPASLVIEPNKRKLGRAVFRAWRRAWHASGRKRGRRKGRDGDGAPPRKRRRLSE